MDMKAIYTILILLATISLSQAAVVTDSITSDGSYWTAPDGVTLVDIKLIGAGGSGSAGGYVYQVGSPTTYYLKFAGAGGLKGNQVTYTSIRVTPGTSYQVHVGMPGQSSTGLLYACPSTGTSTFTFPSPGTEYHGNPSYVTIDGVTYSSSGGYGGNITVQCTAGYNPSIISMNNYNSAGITGYIVQSLLGQAGSNSGYGYGGSSGYGYGAGGGGGGPGGDYTSITGGAGSSGVGAQGIVQFSYNSGLISSWYPSGYVESANASAIPSASVEITQSLSSLDLTTDSFGGYNSSAGGFIVNVPVNITISKPGYETDINIFTPISSTSSINTTLLDTYRYCNGTCIDGVSKTEWDGSSIPGSSIFLLENISRTGYQSNTSTESGYYRFAGLSTGVMYDIWSTKTGYINSSVYQVVP